VDECEPLPADAAREMERARVDVVSVVEREEARRQEYDGQQAAMAAAEAGA
jgi:hypothetical protein